MVPKSKMFKSRVLNGIDQCIHLALLQTTNSGSKTEVFIEKTCISGPTFKDQLYMDIERSLIILNQAAK